ncbi:unnamed protein product [Meganyctiphanes norvegica]|uniref:G kinase-anchoring protein 1 n=1 Tax=Meganyctiphanes norvegica TaxID=48144 RepID=A0AAV2Q1V6_MEGNR
MSSRFALLDIDVDLDDRIGKKKQNDKSKKDENSKKNQNKPNNKKKKGESKDDSLHSLAFGGKNNKGKKKGEVACKSPDNKERVTSPQPDPVKVNGATKSVDDDWKRRDDEFCQDENERVLREALMLSKLDFEEKKDFYADKKKEQDEESKRGGKVKKKKAGPVTMSLGEFNTLLTKKESSPAADIPGPPQEISQDDETFFDDIEEATKKTIEREQRRENYRATAGQFSQEVRATQYEAEIEKRDFEIQALRLEVDSLKEDLKLVKNRNKKLCEVICSAEMKAKAELVVEIDKMTKVRDELTNEVMKLSQELEQERSKVHQLTQESRKSHGKKKHNSDSSTKD